MSCRHDEIIIVHRDAQRPRRNGGAIPMCSARSFTAADLARVFSVPLQVLETRNPYRQQDGRIAIGPGDI